MSKRVTSGFAVWVDGSPRAYPGGALVADDDPILKTHGHLFADVDTITARDRRGPEQATADPGDLRSLTKPATPPGPYDPAQDTVKGVLAYLDGLDDEDEARRVLDAEQASANPRQGIVTKRDEVLARYAS